MSMMIFKAISYINTIESSKIEKENLLFDEHKSKSKYTRSKSCCKISIIWSGSASGFSSFERISRASSFDTQAIFDTFD